MRPKKQSDSEITRVVSLNIAAARKEKGWTQRQLAERAGVSEVTVTKWESNNGISPENLEALARLFGKQWHWFYQDHAQPMEVNRKFVPYCPLNLKFGIHLYRKLCRNGFKHQWNQN